jgi:N-dimethylarginine dimethylaminohydrolase
MGSSLSKIYDDMAEEQWDQDKKMLEKLGEEIKEINPHSQEFRDLVWVKNNFDRIIGNRRLIELLR